MTLLRLICALSCMLYVCFAQQCDNEWNDFVVKDDSGVELLAINKLSGATSVQQLKIGNLDVKAELVALKARIKELEDRFVVRQRARVVRFGSLRRRAASQHT